MKPHTVDYSQLSDEERSEEDSEPRRFRQIREVYNDTEEVELHDELMLMGVDEPVCCSQAVKKYGKKLPLCRKYT